MSDLSVLIRIVALVVLAVGVEAWLQRHAGIGRDAPWLAFATTAVTGALGVTGHLFRKRQSRVLARLRRWAEVALADPLIVAAYGTALVGVALFASVTVVPERPLPPDAAPLGVTLSPLRSSRPRTEELRPADELVRFLVFTNPLGRLVRLKVDGYLEEPFVVYPVVGARVVIERDLRRSPALLLRPPVRALDSLQGGGYLRVSLKEGTEMVPLVKQSPGYRGSFLLGRSQAIPAASLAIWRLELTAFEVPETLLARTLVEWSRPRVETPLRPLAPGMVVVAEIVSGANVPVARAEITLTTDPLIDVGLLPITEQRS